jgi:hypothetical protein
MQTSEYRLEKGEELLREANDAFRDIQARYDSAHSGPLYQFIDGIFGRNLCQKDRDTLDEKIAALSPLFKEEAVQQQLIKETPKVTLLYEIIKLRSHVALYLKGCSRTEIADFLNERIQ